MAGKGTHPPQWVLFQIRDTHLSGPLTVPCSTHRAHSTDISILENDYFIPAPLYSNTTATFHFHSQVMTASYFTEHSDLKETSNCTNPVPVSLLMSFTDDCAPTPLHTQKPHPFSPTPTIFSLLACVIKFSVLIDISH